MNPELLEGNDHDGGDSLHVYHAKLARPVLCDLALLEDDEVVSPVPAPR